MKLQQIFQLNADNRKSFLGQVVSPGEPLKVSARFDSSECDLVFRYVENNTVEIDITFRVWRGVGEHSAKMVVRISDGHWGNQRGVIYRSFVDKTISDLYRGLSGHENYSLKLPGLLVEPARAALLERLTNQKIRDSTLSVAKPESVYVLTIADKEVGYYKCEIDEVGTYLDGRISTFNPESRALTPLPLSEVLYARQRIDALLIKLGES